MDDLAEKQALNQKQSNQEDVHKDLVTRLDREDRNDQRQGQARKCSEVQIIISLIKGCIAQERDALSGSMVVGVWQGKQGRIRLFFQLELAGPEGGCHSIIVIARRAAFTPGTDADEPAVDDQHCQDGDPCRES